MGMGGGGEPPKVPRRFSTNHATSATGISHRGTIHPSPDPADAMPPKTRRPATTSSTMAPTSPCLMARSARISPRRSGRRSQQDVRGDSDASDEGQDDRRRPDEDRVDAQPAGQPRAHAAEPAALGVTNGAQTSQPGEGVVEE